MDLDDYGDKRNFLSSTEPGDNSAAKDDKDKDLNSKLSFVVQKHYASQLHYDFILHIDKAIKHPLTLFFKFLF